MSDQVRSILENTAWTTASYGFGVSLAASAIPLAAHESPAAGSVLLFLGGALGLWGRENQSKPLSEVDGCRPRFEGADALVVGILLILLILAASSFVATLTATLPDTKGVLFALAILVVVPITIVVDLLDPRPHAGVRDAFSYYGGSISGLVGFGIYDLVR